MQDLFSSAQEYGDYNCMIHEEPINNNQHRMAYSLYLGTGACVHYRSQHDYIIMQYNILQQQHIASKTLHTLILIAINYCTNH